MRSRDRIVAGVLDRVEGSEDLVAGIAGVGPKRHPGVEFQSRLQVGATRKQIEQLGEFRTHLLVVPQLIDRLLQGPRLPQRGEGPDQHAQHSPMALVQVVFADNDVVPLPGQPDLDEQLRELAAAARAPTAQAVA